MTDPRHTMQGLGEVHQLKYWEWTDSATRLADIVTGDDVGRFGLQLDTDEYYELTAISPDTWVLRMGSGTSHDAVTLSADAGTNLLSLAVQEIGLNTQADNLFFAGPTTGGPLSPSFRAIDASDLPGTFSDTASTSGVGLFTVQTIPVATNTTVHFESVIVGRQTGGAVGVVGTSARYLITSIWKDVAGALSQVGTTTTIDQQEEVGTWGAIYAGSGSDVIVRVSLVDDRDIDWAIKTEVVVI